jgi:hypothetical protein
VDISQPHHVVILVLKRGDGEMSDVQREVHRYLNVVDPPSPSRDSTSSGPNVREMSLNG